MKISIVEDFWDLLNANGFDVIEYRVSGLRVRENIAKVMARLRAGKGLQMVPACSQRVRLVSKGDDAFYLYVKESSTPNGFWGVTNHIIEELRQSRMKWALVLLHNHHTQGYLFYSEQVIELTNGWTFKQDDGDYKVNAPNDVVDGHKFITEKKLFTLLEAI